MNDFETNKENIVKQETNADKENSKSTNNVANTTPIKNKNPKMIMFYLSLIIFVPFLLLGLTLNCSECFSCVAGKEYSCENMILGIILIGFVLFFAILVWANCNDNIAMTEDVNTNTNVCPQCKRTYPNEVLYCYNCNERLQKIAMTCPNCHRNYVNENYSFCEDCGSALVRIHITNINTTNQSQDSKYTPVSTQFNQAQTTNPNEVHCPKCGSTQITAVQRKWTFMAGFATNKVDRFCMNCKHKW